MTASPQKGLDICFLEQEAGSFGTSLSNAVMQSEYNDKLHLIA